MGYNPQGSLENTSQIPLGYTYIRGTPNWPLKNNHTFASSLIPKTTGNSMTPVSVTLQEYVQMFFGKLHHHHHHHQYHHHQQQQQQQQHFQIKAKPLNAL